MNVSEWHSLGACSPPLSKLSWRSNNKPHREPLGTIKQYRALPFNIALQEGRWARFWGWLSFGIAIEYQTAKMWELCLVASLQSNQKQDGVQLPIKWLKPTSETLKTSQTNLLTGLLLKLATQKTVSRVNIKVGRMFQLFHCYSAMLLYKK